jgi:hypothetical protein
MKPYIIKQLLLLLNITRFNVIEFPIIDALIHSN